MTNSFGEPKEYARKDTFTCNKCKHKAIITEYRIRRLVGGEWMDSFSRTEHNKPPKTCECDCHVPWHFVHHTKPESKETVNA